MQGNIMHKKNLWHESDMFWETVDPIFFTEQRWLNTPLEITRLISLLNLEPGAKVLDLCCGVGRHSIELAKKGFPVTGVDRTKSYITQAKLKSKQAKLAISFIQADMREFCQPKSFDAVINMFTAFGYFENPNDDKRVVKKVYQSLKPGGSFLLELMGKEILARIFLDRNWHEENGILILEERKLAQNWGWIDNRWILIKGNKRTEFKVSHRIYSAVELINLLKDSGFRKVEAFGDLTGAPYDQTAKRLVVVAKK
jgi:SAM-dependent methyltransferase